MQRSSLLSGTALALAGAGVLCLSPPAFGQAVAESAASPAAEPQELPAAQSPKSENADIVVTGSRVARSGFDQPTPTAVIGTSFIADSGAANVAEALNLLPQLRSTVTPGSFTSSVALAGKNLFDLRGLGTQRTLTLVDGRRFVSGTVDGPVDANSIPQALIDTVDVVTGGASAAYGSDAVSGVVNLKLLKRLDGIKATFSGGITDHNDYRNYLASIAVGKTFAEGRGQVIVSAEAAQNSGVTSISKRDWAAAHRGVVANPAFTATNAEPANFLVSAGAAFSNSSYGGVITSGPLRGIQFGVGGQPLPFNFGTLTTARTQLGGDGAYLYNDFYVVAPTRRKVLYGHVDYEVSDAFKPYIEGSYADSRATAVSTTREDTAITINNDNAFLPASIRTAMAAANIRTFVMGRFSSDYGSSHTPSVTKTWRVVLGATGFFGRGWSYDLYYTHGNSDGRQNLQNVRINANYANALDSIIDPATGAAVCRNAAARAAGCVPINLFGPGSPSAESVNYVTADAPRQTLQEQDVVSATLRNEPFDTWAGPVSIAFGGEYRHEFTSFTTSALSQAFALATGNALPFSGSVNVKEAFAEAVVPLAKDSRFAEAIDINLAGRITDYSTSGTVKTWKVGANWAFNDVVRLRGTISRDIRAPSASALFTLGMTSLPSVLDPQTNQTYPMRTITSGNPALTPEIATTKTVGLVLTRLIPGFRFSIDYYDIKIDDAIATLGAEAIVRRCFQGDTNLCSFVTRSTATGLVTNINVVPQNLQTVRAKGVDVEADYAFPFAGGKLSLRSVVNYAPHVSFNDGVVTTRLDGSILSPFVTGTNGVPHWRGIVSADYDVGPLSAFVAARYIGGANLNNAFTAKDFDILRVPSVAYVDASLSYRIISDGKRKLETFFHVSNLLDRDPPLTNGLFGTEPTVYDLVGRAYRAGVRFDF